MELSGYVSSIRYRREETGYTVFELVSDNIGYTVIAKVADIDEGANVHVAGEMVMHPVYGEQINASVCEVSVPDDTDGLLMYLGSGAIRGVGETMASRIIEKFGSEAAHILENEPEGFLCLKYT